MTQRGAIIRGVLTVAIATVTPIIMAHSIEPWVVASGAVSGLIAWRAWLDSSSSDAAKDAAVDKAVKDAACLPVTANP